MSRGYYGNSSGPSRRREMQQTISLKRLYNLLEDLGLFEGSKVARQALNEARAAKENLSATHIR